MKAKKDRRSIRVASDAGLCVNCGVELSYCDTDLHGDFSNAECAKCRAEESHDFDAEPQARFSRCGTRLDV